MNNGKVECSFPRCDNETPAMVNDEPRCMEHLPIAIAVQRAVRDGRL